MSDSLGPRPFDFMPGYTNTKQTQYMNMGYVSSPYPGKTGQGDYGPLQGGGIYYRPENPTYPYPMDFNTIPWARDPPPKLAYAQDIPIFLRRKDQVQLLEGAFGKTAQRQAVEMANRFGAKLGDCGCMDK